MKKAIAVFLRPGSKWNPDKPVREQAFWDDHARFMDALFDDGIVVLGGPFADGSASMVILETGATARSFRAGGGGVSGRYIWLGIPQVGRAIFTLIAPPEGSGFTQTAVANENQLVFWIDGVQYEWLSKSRIVPAEGSFHIWMKFDPTFSFPPLKAPPEIHDGTRWSHGAFGKLPGEKKEE